MFWMEEWSLWPCTPSTLHILDIFLRISHQGLEKDHYLLKLRVISFKWNDSGLGLPNLDIDLLYRFLYRDFMYRNI